MHDYCIAPSGELCLDTIGPLQAAAQDAVRHGRDLVVDLADVTILSAAALAVLSQCPRVRVCNPSALSRSVLEAVGLEHLISE
jgi:anti-anti-sigma regulatory factor